MTIERQPDYTQHAHVTFLRSVMFRSASDVSVVCRRLSLNYGRPVVLLAALGQRA